MILGVGGAGKSEFINQVVSASNISTIPTSSVQKYSSKSPNSRVHYWDTAGQDIKQTIDSIYNSNIKWYGIIFMVDLFSPPLLQGQPTPIQNSFDTNRIKENKSFFSKWMVDLLIKKCRPNRMFLLINKVNCLTALNPNENISNVLITEKAQNSYMDLIKSLNGYSSGRFFRTLVIDATNTNHINSIRDDYIEKLI